MFKTALRETPFYCEEANLYFQDKINGDSSAIGDATFLSTLRALIVHRMGDKDTLYLDFNRATLREHITFEEVSPFFRPEESGRIYICDLAAPSAAFGRKDSSGWTDVVAKKFQNTYQEWMRLEKITTFFKKQFQAICYINQKRKSVVIFTENLNIKYMHYLQCAIPVFFPWYFDPKKRISEREMRLIKSLRENNVEEYVAALADIASGYDFRGEFIQRSLAGFETRAERLEYNNTENEIQRITTDIERLNNRIGDYLEIKAKLETRLLGLATKIEKASGKSELTEYFLCNKKLHLKTAHDSEIIFVVADYLTYFDEEMAKRVINNPTSYIYSNARISADDIKMLMDAIFIDQQLRIKLCAAYELRLNGYITGLKGYDFNFAEQNCMPNPHIDSYACLGNYLPLINKLLLDKNYILAIEQCVASCKSLNFGDSTVMHRFTNTLYAKHSLKCIELPDGSMTTPSEAIEWLKRQKGTSNE